MVALWGGVFLMSEVPLYSITIHFTYYVYLAPLTPLPPLPLRFH